MMTDVSTAIVWGMANLTLSLSAWCFSNWLYPEDCATQRAQHTLVLSWALIVESAFVLDLCHSVSGLNLLLLVSVLAIAAVSVLPSRGVGTWPTCKSRKVRPAQLQKLYWLGWSILGAWTLARTIRILLVPEFPQCWDTLNYHLPFVDQWLQARSLNAPAAMKWFFPGNSEILALWMTGAFTGDFLAALNNLPMISLLVLSSINLARQLRFPSGLQHITALILVTNSVAWYQTFSNKNDLATTAALLAALNYLMRALDSPKKRSAVMLAICMGLLIGVKYYALLYGVVLFGVFLIADVMLSGWRRTTRNIGICTTGMLLCGGYWYLRNFIVSGMPLYPKSVVLGAPNAPGANSNYWHTTLLGTLFERHDVPVLHLWELALWHSTGPCNWLAALLLPLSLLYLLTIGCLEIYHKRRRLSKLKPAVLAAVCAGALCVYLVTPFTVGANSRDLLFIKEISYGYVAIRLGFPFLCLSVICAATAILEMYKLLKAQQTKGLQAVYSCRTWKLMMVGVSICTAFQATVFHREEETLIASDVRIWTLGLAGVTVVAWLSVVCIAAFLRSTTRREFVAIVLAFALSGWSFLVATSASRWHRGFKPNYNEYFNTEIFTYLDQRRFRDSLICVVGSRSFPFYGSQREHVVHQVFRMSALTRPIENAETLSDQLHAIQAQWLVVHRRYYDVDLASLESAEVIEKLWEDQQFRVYRVIGPSLER